MFIMDLTKQFKASVMTVKLQRKGQQHASQATESAATTKQRILAKSKSKDDFSRQAKDVCHKITQLRNVLLENRSAYLRLGQHLKSAVSMTDEERDLIDRETEKFIIYYTQHLAEMRSNLRATKKTAQQRAHMEAVLELLINYLSAVQKLSTEQRNKRVQHELLSFKLLKLAADKKKIPVRPATTAKATTTTTTDSESEGDTSNDSDMDLNDDWQQSNNAQLTSTPKYAKLRQRTSNELKTLSQTSQEVALHEDIEKSQQMTNAEQAASAQSAEDDVQMQEENVALYQELQGVSEEVDLIEKNVVDIAQLQNIFTEKVSLQQHNIERIANAVVGATENIKDANDQIRQAIQRNAGLRVWSLFFLLVMSFALLFLDWYYD